VAGFDLLHIVAAGVGGLLLLIALTAAIIVRLAGGHLTVHLRMVLGGLAVVGVGILLSLLRSLVGGRP
jgi:hypothetical protein